MNKRILIFLTDVGMTLKDGIAGNNTVEELLGLYRALEKQGHEPWLLMTDGTAGPYRAMGREESMANLATFDELCMNREMPNFYGGSVNKNHLWSIQALCRFEGRVSMYFCDPDMGKAGKIGAYLKQAHHKLYTLTTELIYDMKIPMRTREEKEAIIPSQMLVDNWHKTQPENVLVRTAYPNVKHPINSRFPRIEFVDSWREQLYTVRDTGPVRMFDVDFTDMIKSTCYVGSNKPSRFVRLTHIGLFTPEAEDRGLIKFYGKCDRPLREMRGDKVERFGGSRGRVEIDSVNQVYENHVSSLVIGAPSQANSGINHRFLQGLLIDRSMLIDYYQDEKQTFVDDPFLKDVLYFKDAKDLIEKLEFSRVESNFNEIIRKLKIEGERVRHEPIPNLIARASR